MEENNYNSNKLKPEDNYSIEKIMKKFYSELKLAPKKILRKINSRLDEIADNFNKNIDIF